MKFGTIMHSYI